MQLKNNLPGGETNRIKLFYLFNVNSIYFKYMIMKKRRLKMNKSIIRASVVFIIILSSLLASCIATTTQTPENTSTQTQSTTSVSPTQTPAATSGSTTTKWWDKYGTPQYGGKITFAGGFRGLNLDVYQMVAVDNDFWYEALFTPSWTVDRQTWNMTSMFIPEQYWSGNLAESWTITDPATITIQLRQGIHWQNKAPVNGREFVASDVQSHYDRLLGTGGGYTEPAPMYAGMVSNWESVTATDKYTVVFKFKNGSDQNFQSIADNVALNEIEAPEWVALGGGPSATMDISTTDNPLTDWTTAVGTGPWMLTDFISGSTLTFSKNPDYWGYDPRYPQNQLPYADTLTLLVISDSSTRLSALRTGKIDTINSGATAVTWQDEAQLLKTNPDMQVQIIAAGADGVGLRVDKSPFTDIRVRQALDMAIDREAIAKSIYGGSANPDPVGMIIPDYTGYAYAYADWPQSLKDQYAYNPTGAKQLLADAGYPDGFDTNVVTTSDTTLLQLMQIFKAYFTDIGVNMEINTMDTQAEQAYTRDGKHDQMSYQALASSAPPVRTIDSFYSKGSDAIYFGLINAPDTAYDQLHEQVSSAADLTTTMQIFQQMDKEIIQQHIIIAGTQYYNYMVWQPWLKGYGGEPTMWGQGLIWSRLWTTNK
jgi:peptide/nickel transport system substrate-binding protein